MTLAADPVASPEARIGGLEPESLAVEFGTPLYVYDLDLIDRQVARLRAALPPIFDVAYAIKANPSLGVVAHLASLGIGADVASGGELATALRAGVDPANIVFTGPGKRDDELEAAVRAGVRAITVESLGELDRLESIAARLGSRTAILLRLATAAGSDTTGVRIGGHDGGKFGMDTSDVRAAADRAVRSTHLRLLGIHAFGASNVLDADTLVDHIEATVRRAGDLLRDLRASGLDDIGLELIDVGGGLGIPYAEDEPELDLDRLGRRLADLAARWAADDHLRDTRLLIEPGRYLVAQAGTYLTRIVDRKTVGDRDVVIVDGGIHHLVRPALVGQPHRIANVTARGRSDETTKVTIGGPLCSGLDVFADEAQIARPQIGDLLGVLDTGAYGYTESMPLFLSHPMPAEVAVRDGRTALLRPRIEPATWLAEQRLPGWT